jgi:hypothetical protein
MGAELQSWNCVVVDYGKTTGPNPKVEDSSSKIDGFMATYISKLKWAWQA